MKIEASKQSGIQPKPNMIITVRDKKGRDNALVVAYCCNCSFDPPMLMVGIVPSRYSYNMIMENKVFVAHIPSKAQQELFNVCGSKSMRDGDKLKEINANIEDGKVVNCGILTDCPVAAECTVVDSIKTGSHVMFVGKVEYVHADEELVDDKGNIQFDKIDMI